ncbi:MAG TPA: ABC transporter permease [Candidatus Acidoferrales bacterium]|nr:ABC transporter permease [Candidatus Acidoferrales bacterium]
MGTLIQDLRYGLRMLRKSPGFTAVAVLTLALGIGAGTAIFTLLNALLYRELPVPHAEQLVELRVIFHNGQHVYFSLPMFQELQRNQRVFSGIFAWQDGGPSDVEVNGKLARNNVMYVGGEFYSELGQRPILGRLIEPADANLNGPISHVAVISYGFWRSRFGSDQAVLGKQILLKGQPFTIIGVTQEGFAGLNTGAPPEITVPITAYGIAVSDLPFQITSGHYLWLSIIGRLKNGVSIPQARAQLSTIWPGIVAKVVPADEKGERRQQYLSMGLYVTSAAHGPGWDDRAQYWKPLFYLMGIVVLMQLVVCVNLASLMLARGAGRMHETSVRMALGAGPLRIATQTLLEGLLLSFAGAALGLAFAFWGTRWLFALLTRQALTPITIDLHPDLRVLAFTAAVAVLTAILFGLTPAVRAAVVNPAALLRQDSRSFAGGSGLLGQGLIVTQISLSLMLVLASTLFTRSFWNLRSANLGFKRASVLNVMMLKRPGAAQNFDVVAYYRELIGRISGLPGVRAAGLGSVVPGTGENPYTDNVAPISAAYVSRSPMCDISTSAPGFFDAIGMKILQGRDFAWSDGPHQPPVAIISSSLAKRLFPHGNAIGAHVRIGTTPYFPNLEIVGVVNDARLYNPRDAHPLNLFTDSLQDNPTGESSYLFVRAAQNPLSLISAISQAIDSFGFQFVARSMTLEEAQSQSLIEERLSAMLSSFFAGFALLLACMGLYGLISQNVTRRTREIGIRMALGAQRRNIMRLVLRQAVVLSLAGILLGVLCSLAVSRLLSTMLYGVSPNNMFSVTGASLALLFIGLIAGYFPARRAMRVDPMVALRYE